MSQARPLLLLLSGPVRAQLTPPGLDILLSPMALDVRSGEGLKTLVSVLDGVWTN